MRAATLVSTLITCIAALTGVALASDPVLYPDGSYRYSAEAQAIPVVTIQQGDLCDIELQAGERINQAVISDSLRWKMTDGISGADTPHVFVKPTENDLRALLTITTSRRVYHIRLVSTNGSGEEFVGFYYPATIGQFRPHVVAAAPTPSPAWTCARPLDSRYRIDGVPEFRPISVCNDGNHTYVNMGTIKGRLPVLVIVGDGNQDEIGNLSFDDTHAEYVLDGVPDKLALLRDSSRGQLRVNIARTAQ